MEQDPTRVEKSLVGFGIAFVLALSIAIPILVVRGEAVGFLVCFCRGVYCCPCVVEHLRTFLVERAECWRPGSSDSKGRRNLRSRGWSICPTTQARYLSAMAYVQGEKLTTTKKNRKIRSTPTPLSSSPPTAKSLCHPSHAKNAWSVYSCPAADQQFQELAKQTGPKNYRSEIKGKISQHVED